MLILVAGFVIWRLMQGPIALDWLAPYIEAGLERSGIGFKVAIGGVRLGIDRATHHLDVRAEDVRLSQPDGEPLARLPEISTSFGLRELLHGQLTPTQLIVERPVIHLVRDSRGALTAQLASPDDTATALGPQMLEQLAGARQSDAPFGLLQRLRIRGATVIVDDQRTRQSWRVERVDVAVERSGKGIRGDFSLAVPMGSSMPELHAQYRYFADRHVLDLDLSIDGVEPTALPPLIPELAQLQHLQLPISGTLRTRIDLDQGSAQGSRLDLVLGKGQLQSEWLPKGIVTVEKGELHAVYAPEIAEIQLESFALDLGAGTELVLGGSLGGITPELIAAARDARPTGSITGKLNATLKHVPMERLDALWPHALSAGGRRWTLENVHDGVVDEASAQLVLDIDPAAHTANVQDAKGALHYHDLTVSYFDGLPPVRHVNGTAVFADMRLKFLPTAGVLKGLKITGGSLEITELDTPLEWLTIDLPVSGPVQDALEVIDTKPLSYAHAIGVDPARVGGRADTVLHFKFPLLASLKLDAIEFSAKATMSGVSIGKVAMDRNLSDGNLTLDLGRSSAHMQGTARLDGIPAKLDAEARRRLDLNFEPGRLTGSLGVDLTYSQLDASRAQAVVTLDLRGAALAIDEAGWKKPADAPGSAKLVIDLEQDRIIRLPQIDVTAQGLEGRLAVTTSDGGTQVQRIDIQRLVAGGNDLSGTVTRRAGGGWNADIHAGRIDGHRLVKEAGNDTSAPSPIPLAVTARIDRLVLGPHKEIGQVAAELLRSGGVWQSARLDGRLPNGQKLALRLGEGGARRFSLQSEDLGATVKLLGIADNVVGGRLTISGQLSGAASKQTLLGHIEGENYSIVGAPVMARILALPSFTGFVTALSGDGLPFSTLRGDFTYNGSRVAIKNLLAFGESLGITANGWVDIERDRLELEGTVAPAYALNSLLGDIPIIGQLLGGGSQGLFAANYRLSGSSDNPDVSVNPLSVLTPGILRQLFAPLVGFPAPQSEQQAVSPPPQSGDAGQSR